MRKHRWFLNGLSYLILGVSSLLVLVPFLWMVSTAFKQRSEVFSRELNWIPETLVFSNFTEAWKAAPFSTFYMNTAIVAFGLVAVQIITTVLAAYAFGRLKFPGRDFIFFLFLVQLMITPQATILPNYFTILSLGLYNTRLAMMLPYFASAFGTFLLRQAFKKIPQDLEDAALMDGAGKLGFLWHVGIPLIRPTILTFMLISITHHWNEFFWPFIITESNRVRTLTIGLVVLAQATESGAEWTLLMAATLIIIIPLIILFVVFQKSYIESYMQSGIKG